MEVKPYLQRIGYEGDLDTSFSTLRKLCDCHTKNVPFDVLDMFGGKRKVLSLEKINDDIVMKRRGGFCYENNGLFCWLLKDIGFEVDILQGQAFVRARNSFLPEFDHMCLMVTTNKGDKYLTDVGWGGTSFVLPLKFIELEEQVQPNGKYRLRKKDDGNPGNQIYLVEKAPKIVINGKKKYNERATNIDWEIMYQFDTKPTKFNDFDDMCAYQQDSKASFLKRNAICCIQTQDGITISWGQTFCKKKYLDPCREEISSVVIAKNEEEFKELLKKEFKIEINFPLTLKQENFTGFTEEQGCCTE